MKHGKNRKERRNCRVLSTSSDSDSVWSKRTAGNVLNWMTTDAQWITKYNTPNKKLFCNLYTAISFIFRKWNLSNAEAITISTSRESLIVNTCISNPLRQRLLSKTMILIWFTLQLTWYWWLSLFGVRMQHFWNVKKFEYYQTLFNNLFCR